MRAWLAICFTFVAFGGLTVRSEARVPSDKETAVIGMIHHVSGSTLTLKDVRVVGTTQPPPGLGPDGLLELTVEKKTKGVTSELKAGDTVQVRYKLDSRKRLRALTVAPAPR
jgi:hypothetical protein